MSGGSSWSVREEALVRSLYPQHGASGVQESLPHRSLIAIRKRAQLLNVVNVTQPREEPKGWGELPTTSLREQLDCVVLRKWRYPVQPRQVWGMVA